jgi:hypothetical protein
MLRSHRHFEQFAADVARVDLFGVTVNCGARAAPLPLNGAVAAPARCLLQCESNCNSR